ncbi:MAG: hypothetical protein RLY87_372, partial [Chloroflexota bacterium]
STFSSHMKNIIGILESLDTHIEPAPSTVQMLQPTDWQPREPVFVDDLPVLILFDELGAGTDPVEGSALARAIINHILHYGVFAIATTHYAELKAYAYTTPGVQNASVEFNAETLSPTYRLMIGVPGRSNALAIASRLGLSTDIIEKARATLPNQELHVDTLLAAIQKERREAAELLAAAQSVEAQAQAMQREFAAERQAFEAQLEQERQTAATAIDDEVKAVRAELRRLRDDVQNVSITKKWMEDAQQRTADLQKSATTRIEKQRRPQAPVAPQPVVEEKRPLQVGDAVFVASINLTGDVVSIDEGDDSAEVQVGGFRLTVPIRELRPGKAKAEPNNTPRPTSIPATPSVALEIDVRGLRAIDACERVDRYIDDAYRAGLPYVRIIHGKGLGALRQALRDQLNQHRQVKSMTGGGASGGEGVTVVHLNEH